MNRFHQTGLSFRHGLWLGALSTLLLLTSLIMIARADVYGIVQLGQGRTHQVGDPRGGAAWQQACCDSIDQQISPAYGVGLGYERGAWAVEGQYRDLGNYSSFGGWQLADDGTPIGTHYGYGKVHVNGLSVAALGRYHFTRDLAAGIELGAFRWHAAWTEYIVGAGQTGFYAYSPQKTDGLGPLIGMLLTWRNLDVRFEILHTEPRDGNFNSVRMISAAFRF
jgi:hypothetical protein